MLVIQVVCNVTNVALKGLFKWEWGEILTGVGIVANPSRIGRSGLNIKRSAKVNRNITAMALTRPPGVWRSVSGVLVSGYRGESWMLKL